MSTATTKPARRAINTDSKLNVPEDVLNDAREFYLANKLANEASRKAEAARARLFKGMRDAGVTSFDVGANTDSGAIILQAVIKPGRSTTVIDVVKLRKELKDDAAFLKVVSATKTSVETHCGTAMVDLCGSVVPGDEAVYVNPKK